MEPARMSIRGLGLIGNLELRGVLRGLRPASEAPVTYHADAVEDGAFLLLNHVRRQGFLDARVSVDLLLEDGTTATATWQEATDDPLRRPLAAREVRYVVESGRRYVYGDLRFEGLQTLTAEQVRPFFLREDALLPSRSRRRFSRSDLDQSISQLRAALRDRGLDQARVTVERLELDKERAEAQVVVRVDEGLPHRLRSLVARIRDEADGPVLEETRQAFDEPLTVRRRADLEQALRTEAYRLGYPDVEVRLRDRREGEPGGEWVWVDVLAEVVRGPRIRLGEVRFVMGSLPLRKRAVEGEASDSGGVDEELGEGMTTAPSTEMSFAEAPRHLSRRARLEGPWLNRLEADEVRGRLAKVGGFRFVRVRYDLVEGEPGVRDVVFDIEPGRRWTVDLLAGFRSYEMLYGGVDAVHRNAFGLGHTLQFRAVQSFKSTEGALTYTVPDALGEDVTLFLRLDALSREEVSFRREELRSTLGTRWLGIGGGHEIGARYTYEILRAVDAPTLGGVPRTEGPTQPDVASLGLDWTWDRRDSVVLPRAGYRMAADLEVAMPEFGGEARFLRPVIEASWHRNLRGGRYLHLGLQHTVAVDLGDDGLLPFNKRIFPGGEDSVRGYQRGEAGPLNADGEVIGAESALVWNVELEQLLTGTWSLVAFVDGVAQAMELKDFPADEVLWSAGLGLRWNTVIGPVRFEYGHNLDPRDGDPRGTWHFSVGFPF